MYTIPETELVNARMVLSAQYAVPCEDLKYIDEWWVPDTGKIFLMFLITDPCHIKYGSTVTYAIGQSGVVSALAPWNYANA